MATSNSTGSQGFFGTINVTWSYDATKQELAVTGTVSGKPMTSKVLSPGNKTGTISGTSGSNTATVGLSADFSTKVLSMGASQTDPARNGNNTGSF